MSHHQQFSSAEAQHFDLHCVLFLESHGRKQDLQAGAYCGFSGPSVLSTELYPQTRQSKHTSAKPQLHSQPVSSSSLCQLLGCASSLFQAVPNLFHTLGRCDAFGFKAKLHQSVVKLHQSFVTAPKSKSRDQELPLSAFINRTCSMITSPGLLTTSHDDSVSVAVSQNTTSGDVKDKPPSPHPVGWTPQTIFKEGELHLRNQQALQSKGNTIS